MILTFSWYTLFPQTRQWKPSHSGITVSSGMEEMPSQNLVNFQIISVMNHVLNISDTNLVAEKYFKFNKIFSCDQPPEKILLNPVAAKT
jgi:hypothetical protein